MEMPAPFFTAFPALKSSPQCHPAPSMPATGFTLPGSQVLGPRRLPLGQALWGGAFHLPEEDCQSDHGDGGEGMEKQSQNDRRAFGVVVVVVF